MSYSEGTLAARPAGAAGDIYYATDLDTAYLRTTADGWVSVGVSVLRREIGLVSGRQPVATVVGGAGEPWVVLGAETINPADWSLGGTTAWALRLHGEVTLLGLHGEVRLWNATDAVEAVAPVTFAAVATTFANAAANIVAGTKLYELQARLLDGAVPADMLNVLKAMLLVTSS